MLQQEAGRLRVSLVPEAKSGESSMDARFGNVAWTNASEPNMTKTQSVGRDLMEPPSYRDREHSSTAGSYHALIPMDSIQAAPDLPLAQVPVKGSADVPPEPASSSIPS